MIGHEKIRAGLETDLPPVTLLRGEPSIGKLTLARHLAKHHGFLDADVMQVVEEPLSIEGVRKIRRFCWIAPYGNEGKLVILRLDRASGAALNGLLKTLEEPPKTVRFILLAAGPTLPTIESRARVYQLGLLSGEELKQILTEANIAASAIDKLIANGDGTVKGTITAPDDRSRVRALMVLRALAIKDPEMFERGFKDFDDSSREWLVRWLQEAMTRQFRRFTEQEMYGLHNSTSFCAELCVALSRNRGARARLGVRAALQPLLRL